MSPAQQDDAPPPPPLLPSQRLKYSVVTSSPPRHARGASPSRPKSDRSMEGGRAASPEGQPEAPRGLVVAVPCAGHNRNDAPRGNRSFHLRSDRSRSPCPRVRVLPPRSPRDLSCWLLAGGANGIAKESAANSGNGGWWQSKPLSADAASAQVFATSADAVLSAVTQETLASMVYMKPSTSSGTDVDSHGVGVSVAKNKAAPGDDDVQRALTTGTDDPARPTAQAATATPRPAREPIRFNIAPPSTVANNPLFRNAGRVNPAALWVADDATVTACATSADGAAMVTGTLDGSVALWVWREAATPAAASSSASSPATTVSSSSRYDWAVHTTYRHTDRVSHVVVLAAPLPQQRLGCHWVAVTASDDVSIVVTTMLPDRASPSSSSSSAPPPHCIVASSQPRVLPSRGIHASWFTGLVAIPSPSAGATDVTVDRRGLLSWRIPPRYLASCGYGECYVALWDPDTWLCVAQLLGHGSHISAMIYSHEADALATGGHDGVVRVWKVSAWVPTGDTPPPAAANATAATTEEHPSDSKKPNDTATRRKEPPLVAAMTTSLLSKSMALHADRGGTVPISTAVTMESGQPTTAQPVAPTRPKESSISATKNAPPFKSYVEHEGAIVQIEHAFGHVFASAGGEGDIRLFDAITLDTIAVIRYDVTQFHSFRVCGGSVLVVFFSNGTVKSHSCLTGHVTNVTDLGDSITCTIGVPPAAASVLIAANSARRDTQSSAIAATAPAKQHGAGAYCIVGTAHGFCALIDAVHGTVVCLFGTFENAVIEAAVLPLLDPMRQQSRHRLRNRHRRSGGSSDASDPQQGAVGGHRSDGRGDPAALALPLTLSETIFAIAPFGLAFSSHSEGGDDDVGAFADAVSGTALEESASGSAKRPPVAAVSVVGMDRCAAVYDLGSWLVTAATGGGARKSAVGR